ncbi:MAG: hypothetical protein WCO60_16445 [Verrucomicrobiota bacterium]
MDRLEALQNLRAACNQISAQITQMHPLVPALGDAPTQNEVLKGLFELTKQVEVVKKHLLRLEKSDSSTLV